MLYDLRKQVVQGNWSKGSRVPSRRELSQQFEVSLPTAHSAIMALQAEGLLESRGPLGTFVPRRLDCLSRSALVFPHLSRGWSRFWKSLSLVAGRLHIAPSRRLDVYFAEASIQSLSPEHTFQRFHQLLDQMAYAGAIFVEYAPYLAASDSWERASDIPRVVISSDGTGLGVPALYPNMQDWVKQTLIETRKLGVKKVGVIAFGGYEAATRMWLDRLEKAGLSSRPEWIQGLQMGHTEWIANVVKLMMSGTSSQTPEALIVADDNLLYGVIEGILSSRNRPVVLSHCNYPFFPYVEYPVHWIGFDIPQLIAGCIKTLRHMRSGEKVLPLHLIPAKDFGKTRRGMDF